MFPGRVRSTTFARMTLRSLRAAAAIAILSGISVAAPVHAEMNLSFGVYTADKPTTVVRQFRPALDAIETHMSELLGQPVTISATFELYPTDDGCCYAIDHTVKAKVPLIGGQVEKFIRGQVADGCLAEMEYVEQQLG